MEVRLIEVQIDIFGQNKSPNDLIINFGHERQVPWVGIDCGLLNACEDGVLLVQILKQLLNLIEIALFCPLHEHVLLYQGVSVQNVEYVRECVFGTLVHQGEFLEQRIHWY